MATATPWCIPLRASSPSAMSMATSPVASSVTSSSKTLGGKGHALNRLMALSVPVPEGFCVPADVFGAVCAHDVDALRSALATAGGAAHEGAAHEGADLWQQVSEAATAVVMGLELPEAFVAAVAAARADIAGPVIVRSSAVDEDGADASFAGQLDSFADVGDDIVDVVDAIRCCWASAFSARALHYRHAKGLAGAAIPAVAVVVQRYVEARYAGVVFTRGPHQPDDVYGEFCVGAGEGLVSGRVTPGAFRGPRDPSGALHIEILPDDDAGALPPLPALESQLRALRRCALEIEAAFGGPQDIEFCVDDDDALWIVQSRPITTLVPLAHTVGMGVARSAGLEGVSPRRLQRFSNANVNENFPDPLSPLLYSIVQRGYRAAPIFTPSARSWASATSACRRRHRPCRPSSAPTGPASTTTSAACMAVCRWRPLASG